jgi:hypothetical protein
MAIDAKKRILLVLLLLRNKQVKIMDPKYYSRDTPFVFWNDRAEIEFTSI